MKKYRFLKMTAKACLLILCLGFGVNRASAQIYASDNAAAYTTWTNGMNLGYGFLPWVLTQNNGPAATYTNYAGFFIGSSGGIDTSNKSFGMYANGAGLPYAIAYRSLSNALAPSEVFKVRFQNNSIASGGYMGFCLRNNNSTNFTDNSIIIDSGTRFAFTFAGGYTDYYISDGTGNAVDSGIPFTSSGLTLEFYLVDADHYELVVKSADGSTVITNYPSEPLAGTSGSGITTFAGFNIQCGSFQNAYFNNFQVSSVSEIPPGILHLSPANGDVYAPYTSPFSFDVSSLFSTISSNDISLVLNGANQTNLAFTGSGTTNVHVVLNTPLQDNETYSGTIIAADASGNDTTNNFGFNTWDSNNPFIEAEDYNFTGGHWIDNFLAPQPNQDYANLLGSNGVDYLEYDLTGTNHPNLYRPGDLPQLEVASDVDHANFIASGITTSYDLAYIQNGEWEDYTHRMNNVTYKVEARMASFGANPTMLMQRLADPTVTSSNQPLASLGTFVCPQTGGPQNWTFVSLKDFFSNPVLVNFPGTNTFRFTCIGSDGSYNFYYLTFVPSTNTATLRPYLAAGFPYPGVSGVQPDQDLSFTIANRQTAVVPGSIQLFLNNTDVSSGLVLDNNAAGTVVSYQPTGYLPPGTNTLKVVFSDGTVLQTNQWQFTVANLPVIPTAYAYPVNSTNRGFMLQIAKASDSSTNVDFPPSVARAEAQLAGTLTNSSTGLPYANEALNGGSYTETNVINYAIDPLFYGIFGVTNAFPDIPAGGTNDIAMAAQMYVQLSPGIHTFGVYSDDGFKFTAGSTPTDTNLVLGLADYGRAGAETSFSFIVQTNGLYPMRLLYFKSQFNGGGVELYSINRTNGNRILINDPANPDSIKAYYQASSPSPMLGIQRTGAGVVLTWTDSSFSLQGAPQVTGTYTNVSGATSPYTNTITGSQAYFRLIQ